MDHEESFHVGETLRDKFAGTAAAEPELLAHHFTKAGMTEAAIEWWGNAGQRSVERSALVEAVAQLTRALDQIETLPSTPALRRDQIRLQAALITPGFSIAISAPSPPPVSRWRPARNLDTRRSYAISAPTPPPNPAGKWTGPLRIA